MQDLIRRQLDQRLNQLRSLNTYDRPTKGWIRAIREALGLTRFQLARRLGIKTQSVEKFERSEENNAITLKSLQNVAEAMNCRLFYVLVPEKPLQTTVDEQILKKATQIAHYISHSMALEDQKTKDEELDRQIKDIADDLKRKKNISLIWDNDE